jgi:hypothetical protein
LRSSVLPSAAAGCGRSVRASGTSLAALRL